MRRTIGSLTVLLLVGCSGISSDWMAVNGTLVTQQDVEAVERQCDVSPAQASTGGTGIDYCMLSYGLIRQDAMYDAAPSFVKAAEIRINRDVPVMVDNGTRLDSVSQEGEGRLLRLDHTIVDDVVEDIDIQYFRQVVPPLVVKNTCRARQAVMLFENDVVFRYRYFDMVGEFITEFDVKLSDCVAEVPSLME
ncbi:hypothetical protein [Enterovibrio norvegicus]|uniref:hypothetical protein n=1 Tax=Enterovibrio norvegicus TaxID=188144 RepID=UPI001F51AA68|nr:hypothetical protein [Enterovibrio norvegicus]